MADKEAGSLIQRSSFVSEVFLDLLYALTSRITSRIIISSVKLH